jgi:hypothetical protein
LLNKFDKENIAIIKAAAQKVFGNNYKFGELELLDRPFTEFNLPMRLYNIFDVMLEYERSTIGIMVKTKEGYVGLSRMTDEQVFKGLKSCKPENMLHNFQALDRLLHKQLK